MESLRDEDMKEKFHREPLHRVRGVSGLNANQAALDVIHGEALDDDMQRTAQLLAIKQRMLDGGAEEVREHMPRPPEAIQINIPVDPLLNASRQAKKEFFSKLIKTIKAKLEIIRNERSLKLSGMKGD